MNTDTDTPDTPDTVDEVVEAAPAADTADRTGELVQAAIDREHETGARGTLVDPTPNENYTLAGVTAALPTPETDLEHAANVRAELDARRSR